MQMPSVGRIVHYTSYGTPKGEYTSQCRAAIIAAVGVDESCSLVVLNPEGLFFNECEHREPDEVLAPDGGTWHWPERV